MCKTEVDDFIGTTLPTPKGGVLTVVGWDGERNNSGNKVYIIECSICSKDKELFPKGFKVTKSTLVNEHTPCGCSKRTSWNEQQQKVRVQRECDKRGYVFHGWVEGFKGYQTKLDIENTRTNNKWSSTNLSNFLAGVGDPKEGFLNIKKASTIEDSLHIKGFHKAGFVDGYKFTRNTERVSSNGYCSYWDYTCPLCSNDEYVKAGLCSGVFTSDISSLKRGTKSCRCSDKYRWTQEQRVYQIEKVCAEEGLTFLGWDNEKVGYKNFQSKFKWVCSEGHECKTMVNDFLGSRGNRCMTCSKIQQKEQGTYYGYYPHRTEEADSLYILDFDGQYIKIGRSFQVDTRIQQLKKQSGIQNITTLYTVNGTHQEVYDLEQALHEHLEDRGFSYTPDWGSVECFDSDSLSLVYKLIDEDINDSSNTLEEGEW